MCGKLNKGEMKDYNILKSSQIIELFSPSDAFIG